MNGLDFSSHPLGPAYPQQYPRSRKNSGKDSHNSPSTPGKLSGKLSTLANAFRSIAELQPGTKEWTPRQGPKNDMHPSSPLQGMPAYHGSPHPQGSPYHGSPHPSLADIAHQEQMLEEDQRRRFHEAESLRMQQEQLAHEEGLARRWSAT
jgi:hypothetical protein